MTIQVQEPKVRPSISEKRPNLAIVIPLYNMRSRYTKTEEFTSVLEHYSELADKHRNSLEFHLVDDGSTDQSQELLRPFDLTNLNIHYLSKNAQKIGAIKHVLERLDPNIRFILHTDFDCKFKPGSLENALKHTDELDLNPNLGGFGLRVVPEDTNTVLGAFQDLEYGIGRFSYILLKREGRVRCVGGAGGLWRKSTYEEGLRSHSGMFISEDMEQTAHIMNNGHSICYASDVILTTKTPTTLKDLIKQRIRWAKGALYSYNNANGFYQGQVLKFLPRKSLHGLMSLVQMATLSLTPGWVLFAGSKLIDADIDTATRIYGLGLGINAGLSALAHNEFSNPKKAWSVLPLSPLLETGVYFSAHAVAYGQFVKERFTYNKRKIKDLTDFNFDVDLKSTLAGV